jgi:hypothetical protein
MFGFRTRNVRSGSADISPAGSGQSAVMETLEGRTLLSAATTADGTFWAGFGGDAQHSGISPQISQALQKIHWHTQVDRTPNLVQSQLFIHYGSPVITARNTVIVPVKLGTDGGFRVVAFEGATGKWKWGITSDYQLPPHGAVPSFSPSLGADGRLYIPGPGGTVYVVKHPDANGIGAGDRSSFYGLSHYVSNRAAYNASVFIDTPITADKAGNVFFGYQVTGDNPLQLQSGVARISKSGIGTYAGVATATGDFTADKVPQNSAPALSKDGKILYVAANHTNRIGVAGIRSHSYLLALDSTTLKVINKVMLTDPTGGDAQVPDVSTASPTDGPDGDVYFGVLENSPSSNHGRGWLLHFSGNLKQTKTPGLFGWDDTASVVPVSMVPSYHGTSKYLLLSKYNNYADNGGSGINKLAILDPNSEQMDPLTGACVMKEVETIAGITPDPHWLPDHPGAVKEWCVNTIAVDPASDSVLVNSEDGVLYRWNLGTNTFSEKIRLTAGVTEAYTPTAIGADGTVFAIQDGILFAVGRK